MYPGTMLSSQKRYQERLSPSRLQQESWTRDEAVAGILLWLARVDHGPSFRNHERSTLLPSMRAKDLAAKPQMYGVLRVVSGHMISSPQFRSEVTVTSAPTKTFLNRRSLSDHVALFLTVSVEIPCAPCCSATRNEEGYSHHATKVPKF